MENIYVPTPREFIKLSIAKIHLHTKIPHLNIFQPLIFWIIGLLESGAKYKKRGTKMVLRFFMLCNFIFLPRQNL
jgi:hypothetical protein